MSLGDRFDIPDSRAPLTDQEWTAILDERARHEPGCPAAGAGGDCGPGCPAREPLDPLATCNGCDAAPADPDSPAGYCQECEAEARADGRAGDPAFNGAFRVSRRLTVSLTEAQARALLAGGSAWMVQREGEVWSREDVATARALDNAESALLRAMRAARVPQRGPSRG